MREEIKWKERKDRYIEPNGKYIKEARKLLRKEDLTQASEKLWGACAEMVKAVAANRNLELGTHASLWEFVSKLDKEHPTWNLLESFSYAGNLHVNFYEGMLTKDYVKRGIDITEDFVSKLKQLV